MFSRTRVNEPRDGEGVSTDRRHSGAMRSIEPGIHLSKHSRGMMDSGPAPSAQNSFAILSRRRIPE